MGPYCRYCQHRCFVLRVMPEDATFMPGKQVLLATCSKGMEYDLTTSGYTHKTAINPYDKEN